VRIVDYKGIRVSCYGEMRPEQNTWFVTDDEDDDEEYIIARGFPTFYLAIDYIVNRLNKIPVEVQGV